MLCQLKIDYPYGRSIMSTSSPAKSAKITPKTTRKAFELIKDKRLLIAPVIFTVVMLLLSIIYLGYSWKSYVNKAKDDALELARSLNALLPSTHINDLTGKDDDLENPTYKLLKDSLMAVKRETATITFAYLYAVRDGKLIILVDSEVPGTDGYSPPGDEIGDTESIYYKPLADGDTIITPPVTDRFGEWISVLVPVTDGQTGEIIAAFGMDYPVTKWFSALWRNMIPDMVIAVFIIILTFLILYGWLLHEANRELNKQLDYDEALYRGLFEKAPIGIAIVDDLSFIYSTDYGMSTINPMFEKIMGRSTLELSKLKWTDITHPDDLQADLDMHKEFQDGKINGFSMEKRFIKPDGSVVWVDMTVSRLMGINDLVSKHLCIISDITARKETEQMLKEVERRQSVLLSHLPGLAYRCNYDEEWTMLFVSDGCYDLTGYHPKSLINNRDISYNDIISPEYRERLSKEWERVLANHIPFKYEYEIITSSGERKWVMEMGQGIFTEDGRVEALEGIVLDISVRKVIENNLLYINEHDRWTGLYNRGSLEKALQEDQYTNRKGKRALIGINLSLIQLLTANYGYQYTQALIKTAASALDALSTQNRRLFYTFENRFVFYITDYNDKSELMLFAEEAAKILDSLFVTDRISGGIGILEINDDIRDDFNLLLLKLVVASERAINIADKDFNICFYDAYIEMSVNRENEIRHELAKIAGDEECHGLYLHYQPILDVKTGKISGFEALARLKSEKLGLVSSAEFIPIAEKTKLIVPIGEKVLSEAFKFLNRLNELGCGRMQIAVNISAIQLLRPDFTDRLFELIANMGVDPRNVGLEITESVFAGDYERINRIIGRLKKVGIQIAVDDFGTGYSSLARVRELNVSCLKIDKSFMDRLLKVNPEEAITGDIISMAHKLGHIIVAEGVEKPEQRDYLVSKGCDKIQGYLISKPLDEDSVIRFLGDLGELAEGCDFNNRDTV